ncbi:MAG: hypothetical protein WDN31_11720 [Hyphomicrobium sp.]
MTVEGGDDLVGALAAERHNVGVGELQIGGHAHFGHGDHRAVERLVLDFAAREQPGRARVAPVRRPSACAGSARLAGGPSS